MKVEHKMVNPPIPFPTPPPKAPQFDIEKYAYGWMSPVHLERLFADVFKTDSRFQAFKPEEIVPQKSGVKASDVAGAISTIVIGIGWKRTTIPTSIVSFSFCPVLFGVFANHDHFMDAKFFFSVTSPNASSHKPGTWTVCIIEKKGNGKGRIEFKYRSFPEIFGELRKDSFLSDKLLDFSAKGLMHTNYVGNVNFDVRSGTLLGSVEFRISHNKKKWKNIIEKSALKPENFVEESFGIARSVAKHVKTYSVSLR